MLNAANNARLFYGKYHDDEHRTRPDWEGDRNLSSPSRICAVNGTARHCMQWAMVKNDWAPTDFGLYGSSHVGLMAACIGATNDEKILQLDLLATDFFHAPAYPAISTIILTASQRPWPSTWAARQAAFTMLYLNSSSRPVTEKPPSSWKPTRLQLW